MYLLSTICMWVHDASIMPAGFTTWYVVAAGYVWGVFQVLIEGT